MLELLSWFVIKHFIADSILQHGCPYKHQNKGKLGHWGGIWHSLDHGILTLLILFPFTTSLMALSLAGLDFICHYFIDLSKVKICKRFNLSEMHKDHLRIKSEWYFQALLIDQMLHYFTYILILSILF